MQQSKISNKLRISTNVIKKSETLKNKNIEENELFILGVLESAAKDKKKKKMDQLLKNKKTISLNNEEIKRLKSQINLLEQKNNCR